MKSNDTRAKESLYDKKNYHPPPPPHDLNSCVVAPRCDKGVGGVHADTLRSNGLSKARRSLLVVVVLVVVVDVCACVRGVVWNGVEWSGMGWGGVGWLEFANRYGLSVAHDRHHVGLRGYQPPGPLLSFDGLFFCIRVN